MYFHRHICMYLVSKLYTRGAQPVDRNRPVSGWCTATKFHDIGSVEKFTTQITEADKFYFQKHTLSQYGLKKLP